jgi:hypothetical protein
VSLPYRWRPDGARWSSEPVKAGDILARDHKAWRVIEVKERPEEFWTDADRKAMASRRNPIKPSAIVIRPVEITRDDPRSRDHDVHLRYGGEMQGREYQYLFVYPNKHYPVCAECHEPLPCRDQMAERISTAAGVDMARYELAGVCPACGEVVTHRQSKQTWPDNAVIPAGPPVTFHLRTRCRPSAARYEKQWVALDPERRRAVLSCTGHVINHNDGTYQCTELTECPGPVAEHTSHSVCRCPDCHARGPFDCYPSPNAFNQALSTPSVSSGVATGEDNTNE